MSKETELQSVTLPAGACMLAAGPLTVQEITEKGEIPITLLARSGGAIDHWYWGNLVHDFKGMTVLGSSIPIDFGHDYDCSIGYLDTFDRGEDLIVKGALVPYPTDPEDKATEIAFKSQRKVPYQASIDFSPRLPNEWELEYIPTGMTAEVNGRQVTGPCTVVRKWTLHAVAIYSHGADPFTEARLSAGDSPLKPVSVLVPKGLAMSLSAAGSAPAPTQPAAPAGDTTPAPAQLTTPAPAATPAAAAQPGAKGPIQIGADQLKSWSEEFGPANAVTWLSAGHDIGEARRLHNAELAAKLKTAEDENQQLKDRLASAKVGEKDALSADAESVDKEKPAADPNASAVDRLTAANEARLKKAAK